MPTPMDFVRVKVQAYKHTLDGKSAKEKAGKVSAQLAEQFNLMLADIKKEYPDAAPHLPRPISNRSRVGRAKVVHTLVEGTRVFQAFFVRNSVQRCDLECDL